MIDTRNIEITFDELLLSRPSVIMNEHHANLLRVDVKKIIIEWPDAWFTILFQRPDGYRYPAATGLTAEDGRVYYLLTGTDTAVVGDLRVEVQARNDAGVLAKDHIFVITVEKSMDAPGEAPDPPIPPWTDTVAEKAREVDLAAINAKASEEAAKEAQQETEAARDETKLAASQIAALIASDISNDYGGITESADKTIDWGTIV